MNQKNSQNFIDIASSFVPVYGAYRAHVQGYKAGMEAVSAAYAEKIGTLEAENRQVRRDALGETAVFLCPHGWDAGYWQQKMVELTAATAGKDLSPRTLLLQFIDICIDIFPTDKLEATKSDLKKIRGVIASTAEVRIGMPPENLELAVDFLDLFKDFNVTTPSVGGVDVTSLRQDLLRFRDEILAALTGMNGCNILVLGKTGTGKSALLNHLLGTDKFESGAGAPVTKYGLHRSEGSVNGIPVTVYDSWGLEANAKSYDEWLNMLQDEKEKHDLRQKVEDWFHTVVYCIQASGHRTENVDFDTVKSFCDDGYHVIVALTKADAVSESEEEKMRQTVLAHCNRLDRESVIGVCSVEKEIRGTIHKPFGFDLLKPAVLSGYIDTVLKRIPKRCCYLATQELEKFVSQCESDIEGLSGFHWSDDENNTWLKNKLNAFAKHLNETIVPDIVQRELKSCVRIGKNLAGAISVDVNIVPSASCFFEDDDEWYVTAAKAVFATIILPFALWNANDSEHERLRGILRKFREKMVAEINNQESAIRQKLEKELRK